MTGGHLSFATRACLLALVFLNLVFLSISGGVGAHWMIPLFGLTVGAPWLVRFEQHRLYRAIWNGGVLAIFGVLLNDLGRTGIRFLLEDGLILAAFCQVHLLNNLGSKQKPDLLFFNSFLIALVTSFFCQDLVFALVFGVYAFVLVIAMQIASIGTGWSRAMLSDGAAKAGTALAVTTVVFAVCPRDFQREGLVGETLRAQAMEVGFSESVELGRSGQAVVSNRVVMQVTLREGHADDIPTHWRGATFLWFEDGRWLPDDRPQGISGVTLDDAWLHARPGRWIRPGNSSVARVTVELSDVSDHRLFAPLESTRIDLAEEGGLFVQPRADGSLKGSSLHGRSSDEVWLYDISVSERMEPVAGRYRLGSAVLPHLRADGHLPPEGRRIVQRMVADNARAEPRDLVEVMRRHLAESYVYMLPGTQGAARDLEEFFAGKSGGHCEFFATALALMLREAAIPCRLVTGYHSREWDEAGRVLTVRSKHAHAWVEVLDPSGAWYVVDPTPASGGGESAEEVSWWATVSAAATGMWETITSFDADARAEAIAWLKQRPSVVSAWVVRRPIVAALVGLAVLAAWRALRWWRRRGSVPDVLDYLEAVRRAGLSTRPGETPRELLVRAQHDGVAPRALSRLVAATSAHELARYGSS